MVTDVLLRVPGFSSLNRSLRLAAPDTHDFRGREKMASTCEENGNRGVVGHSIVEGHSDHGMVSGTGEKRELEGGPRLVGVGIYFEEERGEAWAPQGQASQRQGTQGELMEGRGTQRPPNDRTSLGRLHVSGLRKGGAAELVGGVSVGDQLLKVDSIDATTMSLEQLGEAAHWKWHRETSTWPQSTL